MIHANPSHRKAHMCVTYITLSMGKINRNFTWRIRGAQNSSSCFATLLVLSRIRVPTLWVPLGWRWPCGRRLSQWFPAPTAAHGREPPWRAPEAPRHSFPPRPARCCGKARWYICNDNIKYDFSSEYVNCPLCKKVRGYGLLQNSDPSGMKGLVASSITL